MQQNLSDDDLLMYVHQKRLLQNANRNEIASQLQWTPKRVQRLRHRGIQFADPRTDEIAAVLPSNNTINQLLNNLLSIGYHYSDVAK